jgi:hypothetical protein
LELQPDTTAAPPSREEHTARIATNSLTIRCWPARERPVSVGCITAASAVVATFLGYTTGSTLYGMGAILIIQLVLWRVWTPIHYRIGDRGIVQTIFGHPFPIPWRAVGRVKFVDSACVVYRSNARSPLASMESVVIEFQGKESLGRGPEEVELALRELFGRYVGQSEPSRNS